MERVVVDWTPGARAKQLPQIQTLFRLRSLREEARSPGESEAMKKGAEVKGTLKMLR